jgi:hypothetical protein
MKDCVSRACTVFAAEREREADDHALDLVLADQLHDAGDVRALDDADRARDRSGRVRHRDAGTRPAVVSASTLHFSAAAIACLPARARRAAPAGFFASCLRERRAPAPTAADVTAELAHELDGVEPLADERVVEVTTR